MLSVVMLNVVMLSVVMLNAVMLSVVMLSVVAPAEFITTVKKFIVQPPDSETLTWCRCNKPDPLC